MKTTFLSKYKLDNGGDAKCVIDEIYLYDDLAGTKIKN